MTQYTITLTIKTSENITEKWQAETFAQVAKGLVEQKHPFIDTIETKVLPTIQTRAYPGEVHQDCGKMVPYGGALLHQC